MLQDKKKPQPERGFFVTIVTSNGQTTRKVDGDLLTVGRAEDSNLVIAHETLSRRHLTIRRQGTDVVVEDHGSSNGSFVNGKRIKPHVPTQLDPADVLTMGEAAIRLRASLGEPRSADPAVEAAPARPAASATKSTVGNALPKAKVTDVKVEPAKATPPTFDDELTASEIFEPTNTIPEMPRSDASVSILRPKLTEDTQLLGERIVAEAQRKATLIISQAEVEAERRAQDILRKVHDAQSQADEQYQKRMNDAFRASEQLSQDAQRESRELMETARERSGEIRAQAETYVAELRARTKLECEKALAEAQRTAREMKEQKMAEAADDERRRHDDAVAKTKAELDARVAQVERQMTEDGNRRRGEIEAGIKAATEQHQSLRSEIESLIEMKSLERGELTLIRADLALDREEYKELESRRANTAATEAALSEQLKTLTAARDEAEAKVKDAQGKLVALNEDLTENSERLNRARVDVEMQLAEVKARLDSERQRLEAEESALLQNAKLETTRRARDFELQMMDELQRKKQALTREVGLTVEAYLKTKGLADVGAAALDTELGNVIERQIETIAQDDTNKRAQVSLVAMRRRQKWVSGGTGALLGIAALSIGLRVQKMLSADESPMQRRVAAAQEARAKDLEERKFNPPRTPGYKATYFDNVVYTERFVETYTDSAFQARLMKEMAPYMLRMWRLDENKVIEALAISSAAVRALGDKRELINPDFVQRGLDAMKEAEAESLRRLRETLGSQVRLESFLKFEKTFYDGYRPAP